MSLTPPPTAPSTSDPTTFNARADALVAWLATHVAEETALVASLAGSYAGSSVSAVAIGSGSKSFTATAGLAYQIGQPLMIASAADPTNYMTGQVTAYNSTTGALTVNVPSNGFGGSGTKSDWVISLIPTGVIDNQYVVDTGAANAYVITPGNAPAAYTVGETWNVLISHANSGASTLNRNGLGAKPLATPYGGALVTGQLLANIVVTVRYDGTSFQVIGALPRIIGSFSASSSNTVPHNTNTLITAYGTNTNSIINSPFSSGVLTVGAGGEGWYLISAELNANLSVGAYGYALTLLKNGAAFSSTVAAVASAMAAGSRGSVNGTLVYLTAADTVQVQAFQNSGSSQSMPINLSIVFLGK